MSCLQQTWEVGEVLLFLFKYLLEISILIWTMVFLLAALSKQKLRVQNKKPQICMCAGTKRKDFYNSRNTRLGIRLCLVCLITRDDWWVGTRVMGRHNGSEPTSLTCNQKHYIH